MSTIDFCFKDYRYLAQCEKNMYDSSFLILNSFLSLLIIITALNPHWRNKPLDLQPNKFDRHFRPMLLQQREKGGEGRGGGDLIRLGHMHLPKIGDQYLTKSRGV